MKSSLKPIGYDELKTFLDVKLGVYQKDDYFNSFKLNKKRKLEFDHSLTDGLSNDTFTKKMNTDQDRSIGSSFQRICNAFSESNQIMSDISNTLELMASHIDDRKKAFKRLIDYMPD